MNTQPTYQSIFNITPSIIVKKPNRGLVERVKTSCFGNHLPHRPILFHPIGIHTSHLILSYANTFAFLGTYLHPCTMIRGMPNSHLNQATHDCIWQGFRLLCVQEPLFKWVWMKSSAPIFWLWRRYHDLDVRLWEINGSPLFHLQLGTLTSVMGWNVSKSSMRMGWNESKSIVSFKFFQGWVQGSRATSYPNYMHDDKTMIDVGRGGSPDMQVICPLANSNVDNIHLLHLHWIWLLSIETHQECRPHYHWLHLVKT